METYEWLLHLADKVDRARDDLYEAVVQAVEGGMQKLVVHQATGLSRVTIDRIIRQHQEAGQ